MARKLSDAYIVREPMHSLDGAWVHGAFGVLYAGTRKRDGRMCAIKFTKCKAVGRKWYDTFNDPEQRPLLLEEPVVHSQASALKHPGIVELFDAFEEPLELPEIVSKGYDRAGKTNRMVLCMELLTGHDLFDVLARGLTPEPVLAPLPGEARVRRPFNEVDKRHMFMQIASAVAALHAAGIVHRDIKPHNIVMKAPPKPGVMPELALIDFGLAISSARRHAFHWTADTSSDVRYGRTGIIGTRDFAAPELFVSPSGYSGCYNAPIDVYALGLVLYFMLMGLHGDDREDFPFDIGTDETTFAEHRAHRQRLKFLTPGHTHHTRSLCLSPQSKDLLVRMLDPNPSTRITAPAILVHPWATAAPPELLSQASIDHHEKVPYGFSSKRRGMNVRLLASVAAGAIKSNVERFKGVEKCLHKGDVARIYAEFHALQVTQKLKPSALYTPPKFGPRLVAGISREGMLSLLTSERVGADVARTVVEKIFGELDKDGDGLVRWKEFIALLPLLADGPIDEHYPMETLSLFWDCWVDDGESPPAILLAHTPPPRTPHTAPPVSLMARKRTLASCTLGSIGGTGRLSQHALHDMLCTLHGLHPVGAEEEALNKTVESLFDTLDSNHDHVVSFEDFLRALHSGRAAA